jgi:hypothetical protein
MPAGAAPTVRFVWPTLLPLLAYRIGGCPYVRAFCHLTPARLSLSLYSDRCMPSRSLSPHSCRTSFFFFFFNSTGSRECVNSTTQCTVGNGFNGAVSKLMLGADVAEDRCMHVDWCVHAADISKNLEVIHACTPTNHGDPIDISDHRKTHVLYGVLRKKRIKAH